MFFFKVLNVNWKLGLRIVVFFLSVECSSNLELYKMYKNIVAVY